MEAAPKMSTTPPMIDPAQLQDIRPNSAMTPSAEMAMIASSRAGAPPSEWR